MRETEVPAVQSLQAAWRRACWFCVSAVAVLPVLVARFPPLYDYYHWVFQGYLVHQLRPWATATAELANSLYSLKVLPIPNLAAPVGIGLLNFIVSPANAGRVFLVICILGFGYGFGYLVRGIQRRPTAIEFIGFPWAYGYYLYKGYLSYLFALAVAFFAIGRLQRCMDHQQARLRRADLAGLSLLATFLFLCHLLGWAIFVLAVAVYVWRLCRQREFRKGLALAATLGPSFVLLSWYILSNADATEIEFYEELTEKLISLINPLMLFLRTDPLPPAFPLGWANLLGWAALIVLIGTNVAWRGDGRTRSPLRHVGILLAAIAVTSFFGTLGGSGRPDERLIIPALLICIATQPHKPFTRRRGVVAAGLVILLLAPHIVEYGSASSRLEQFNARATELIPPGTPVYSVIIWHSRTAGACDADAGPSFGTPALRWFDMMRYMESGGVSATLMETSLVGTRLAYHLDDPELWSRRLSPGRARQEMTEDQPIPTRYRTVELFGCRDDLDSAIRDLEPEFSVMAEDSWYAILHRSDLPPLSPQQP